jgi:hypothetical protein
MINHKTLDITVEIMRITFVGKRTLPLLHLNKNSISFILHLKNAILIRIRYKDVLILTYKNTKAKRILFDTICILLLNSRNKRWKSSHFEEAADAPTIGFRVVIDVIVIESHKFVVDSWYCPAETWNGALRYLKSNFVSLN